MPISAPTADQLDQQEQKILRLLYHGQSAKEIARYLAIPHRTVLYRIDRIKTKLGAKNLTHAVAIGLTRDMDELLNSSRNEPCVSSCDQPTDGLTEDQNEVGAAIAPLA